MAERRRKFGRAAERAGTRKSISPTLKVWPMALETNLSRIRRLADEEWNFEKFYEQVRRFAGGSFSREVLQEFMKARQITIKSRPKGGGKMM